ncbi:MAG: ABC transporter ATP-binding protein [Alphaproteobacteria bacterium]
MTKEIQIEMKNVSKAFGKKRVLQDLDLSVARGESVVIIGGSGTGKSVTLKCILGLLHPDKGSIQFNGKNIGMLFQGAALFDSLTVWENVSFAVLQQRGMTRERAKKIAIEKLGEVGLKPEVADVYPSDLSGGMKKRVGLARAIAIQPDTLFFDEPTTGLDPIMSDVINDLIVRCVKKLGATALTITHDMASARKIADKIAMLYDGKIIWQGTVAELDKTDNPYVRQFVAGSSKGPIQMAVKADE